MNRRKSILQIKTSNHWKGVSRKPYTEKKIGKSGHVYVFSLGFDDLYKIGKTTNLQNRQKSLQAGNPKLRFVWSSYTKDCSELEKILHKKMKDFWIERELFKFTSYSIILEINKITENYNNGLPLDS